jgi:hypothetical protein
MYPPPTPAPDQQLEESIQNAWNTSMLVDQMLEVTQNGVAYELARIAMISRGILIRSFRVCSH